MLRKSLAVLLCSCAAAFSARADDVELALTEETLQGTYITDGSMVGLGGSDLSLGLLFSDDRDIVLNAGLMVPGLGEDGMGGDVMPGPITVRFGAKAFGALLADPSDDIFAIAPGVEARYAIPTGIPLAAVANFFYSPDILTFGNAEDVFDFNVRLEAQFVERATGFVGFRRLSFDRDGGGDDDIVEHIQVGVRFAF